MLCGQVRVLQEEFLIDKPGHVGKKSLPVDRCWASTLLPCPWTRSMEEREQEYKAVGYISLNPRLGLRPKGTMCCRVPLVREVFIVASIWLYYNRQTFSVVRRLSRHLKTRGLV
jgi:hypothetical protein